MNAIPRILFAPMKVILASGGDTRSAVDPHTGLNKFGCTPGPRPESLSFGSCTASSISQRAFCHAEAERGNLLEMSSPGETIEAQTERLRWELKNLLGVSEGGAEVVFSASGTDTALQALFLARVLYGTAPLDCIVLASDETGSGVPHALSGRHFSTITSEGIAVKNGEPIAGLSEDVALIPLPMRDARGVVRPPATRDQEVLETVGRSVANGHKVLLQVMDSSKLGARCPGIECLKTIQSRFAGAVQIVVDACQMRISLARLQWHLAQGHMVLISGSKFFTGPPFSGALLAPRSLSTLIEASEHVPPGMQNYTGKCDWPRAWTNIRATLTERANYGQYFRWVAAIEEMRAYFSIPLDFRCSVLRKFASIATRLLCSRHPDLLLIEEGESVPDGIDDAEMAARTIFPFCVRQGSAWMSFEDSVKLYQSLHQNSADALSVNLSSQERALASTICHIGQPVLVPAGTRGNAGALRICAGARTVSDVWSRYQDDPDALCMEQERNDLGMILRKIALLARHAAPRTEIKVAALV
jgi:hypothetical protein